MKDWKMDGRENLNSNWGFFNSSEGKSVFTQDKWNKCGLFEKKKKNFLKKTRK